jgi:DNA polymerase I
MKECIGEKTELIPVTDDLSKSHEIISKILSPDLYNNKQPPNDELSRFYPQVGSYDVVLKGSEHVFDAIHRGQIVFKDNVITALEAPTSSGKGSVARHLLTTEKELLLCVDNLRKLVLQTFNRLMPYGKVVHYEKSKAIKAAGAKALCICLPSIKDSKNVLNYFLDSTQHKNMKVNIVLDEIHLIARELFSDKQLYPGFIKAINGRVNKIISLTATMTECSRIFLDRLSTDLGMEVNYVGVDRQRKKLPATVYQHTSKVQKIDFIIQKLKKNPKKVIIIDQSRTFIEELQAEIAKQLPKKKANIVTASTEEEYDPVAMLTLGSPSMSTGISIDEKVELFMVGFNDNIATPESFEQTLARLRNEKGQNSNTEICVMASNREKYPVPSFNNLFALSVKRKLEALDDINLYLKSNFLDERMEDKLKNRDVFLLFDGKDHFYDPDYLKIQSMDQTEHSFTRKIGTITFLRYFKENPHILSGVEIQSIVDMPEPHDSDVTRIRKTFKETKDQLIDIVKSIEPCKTYAERRRASITLKEDTQDADDFRDLWLKILKHEAITVGVKNLELTPNSLKGQIERKRPIAIINSWFFLKDNNLIRPGELKPEYLAHLQIRRERYVLLYKISEDIWQIWKDFHYLSKKDFNLLASNIMLFLKANQKGSLDVAFGGSEDKTLVRFRNAILGLLGVSRYRSGKPKADVFYLKDRLITLEKGYDFATLFFSCRADGSMDNLEKLLAQAGDYQEVEGILIKSTKAPRSGVFSGDVFKESNKQTLPKRLLSDFELVETKEKLDKSLLVLSKARIIGLDTETLGLDPHQHRVRLLQISSPDNPVFVFDLFKLSDISPIKSILEGDSIKVGQNLKFDLQMLWSTGFSITPPLFDTMIAVKLLTAGLHGVRANLQAITKKYLGIDLPKEQQLSDWSATDLTTDQLTYAARDAQVLLPLYLELCNELKKNDLTRVAQLEFEALPAIAEIEYNGMALDLARLSKKRSKSETRLKELEKQLIHEFNDPDLNLSSPQQIKEALKNVGINVESTGKKILIPLVSHYPIVSKILEYRKLSKLLTSFLQTLPKYINPITKKIHSSLWQCGAVTGRLACSDPNLQQIPRDNDLRACFIAAPGYKMIVADYGQIELKVLAEVTQDKVMIDSFNNGIDVHSLTASLITQKDISMITKEERLRAKAVNFGLSFGMGSESLQSYSRVNYGVVMTMSEAEAFKKRFLDGYPGLAFWHDEQRYIDVNTVRTLSGRRRLFPDKAWFQALLNTPIQGGAADINKRALGLLPQALKGTGARIIGSIHDEVLIEVPDKYVKDVTKIVESTMIKAGEDFIKSVPIQVDVSIGDTWDAK